MKGFLLRGKKKSDNNRFELIAVVLGLFTWTVAVVGLINIHPSRCINHVARITVLQSGRVLDIHDPEL